MSWNKGFTKENHPGVAKISRTMKRRHIDNFRLWREKMRVAGVIPSEYPSFPRSADLAEYIGVVLGDGNISAFPRSERIIITSNADNPGFIARYANLTKALFGKNPVVSKVNGKHAVRISLYQKNIARRLGIPAGNRSQLHFRTPRWISKNQENVTRFLRGLFEAEGSLSIHKPTYTYNLQFSNTNSSLLKAVEKGLKSLGYRPEIRKKAVRLRKRAEIESFRKLSRFREY